VSEYVKSLLRKIAPSFLVEEFKHLGRFIEHQQNRRKTTDQVFTEIYRRNTWGGPRGEFYSGSGSGDERLTAAYVALISEWVMRGKVRDFTFVDLGKV
jgi:hypothetical protein